MSKVPSEDARKVKAYLDGFASGIQHAQDGLDVTDGSLFWTLKGEERALLNIISFLYDEFGDFDNGFSFPTFITHPTNTLATNGD
jgi:hypothetical protein